MLRLLADQNFHHQILRSLMDRIQHQQNDQGEQA
jgi:hypothetical protein